MTRILYSLLAFSLLVLPAHLAFATASLDLQMPSIGTAQANGDVTYTLTVRNTGDTAATNVTLTKTLSAGQMVLIAVPSVTTSTNADGQTILTWSIPSIGVDESFSTSVKVHVGSAFDVVASEAMVTSDNATSATVLRAADVTPPLLVQTAEAPVSIAADPSDPATLPRTGISPYAYLLLLAVALSLYGISRWKNITPFLSRN